MEEHIKIMSYNACKKHKEIQEMLVMWFLMVFICGFWVSTNESRSISSDFDLEELVCTFCILVRQGSSSIFSEAHLG